MSRLSMSARLGAILLACAASAAVLLPGASRAQAAGKIVISNWDGYMAPDCLDAFKTATGVYGEVVVHATNEEIMGKLIAAGGKGYDVVFVSSPFAEVLNKLGLDRADRPRQGPQPRQPLSRGDQAAARSRQHLLGSLHLGHDRPLLPLRPGEDGADQLERPAHAVRRSQGQDHHAGDRPLAAGRRLQLDKGYSVNETDPAKMAEVKDAADRRQEDLARL